MNRTSTAYSSRSPIDIMMDIDRVKSELLLLEEELRVANIEREMFEKLYNGGELCKLT